MFFNIKFLFFILLNSSIETFHGDIIIASIILDEIIYLIDNSKFFDDSMNNFRYIFLIMIIFNLLNCNQYRLHLSILINSMNDNCNHCFEVKEYSKISNEMNSE